MMSDPSSIPLPDERSFTPRQRIQRARQFAQELGLRRTVRDFSNADVSYDVIEAALQAAGSAPSGANLQPWHFVVVRDPEVKSRIRSAAEEEEKKFYEERAPQEWLEALQPLGTDWRKPFLDVAPYLIAVFVQPYGIQPDGSRMKHYYAVESVGIATGMLITALHWAGLATLTHTPSPMGFLNEILNRPDHERAFLLLVTGLPADDATVPDIERKPLEEFVSVV